MNTQQNQHPQNNTPQLPSGWEVRRLGEVCEYDKNQNLHKGLPYVGLEHIESNSGRFLGNSDSQEVKSSTFYFNSEHVLYGRLRPYLNKVLLPDFEGHCSTEIFPIKPKKNVLDRTYLFHWLISTETMHKINATWTGATLPRANMNAVLDFKLLIPPLPEQKRIVAILDEAFGAIAQAKAHAEQNLRNAKALFESYLMGVFENGNWEKKTLNQISENLDNKRVPVTKNKRKSGDIPYYGASGVVDYVADYLFDEDLLCVSEDGANLLARTYPIAFSISGKTWVNNHAHILKFPNIATQRFVEMYINSIRIDDYVSGMAQPKLNQKMLNKIPIPFPSLNEQQTIVRQLDALRAETQKLEGIYQQKLQDLEELKKAILQQAFRGQLGGM